ncbi:tyrosine-type recombinase/integrase [Pleionea litopenaei]|uniref:Tyrosine-type recombinase/integrase n=1 Tax=Pleionea litopenaei TaxID=3070815 RepID=A0AA51RUD4_9GAMM|nr:tyrosine-type recombinase/integrase [Pleionea sp. HL-JVS1]WMS87876.1 tyrosine-type recombinase/integrase [Pleionea sp. HL-JVS1]
MHTSELTQNGLIIGLSHHYRSNIELLLSFKCSNIKTCNGQSKRKDGKYFLTNVEPGGLFQGKPQRNLRFPIQHVHIDFDRMMAKRPQLLATIDEMPSYLLKPEVFRLLSRETDPMYRLILDLMWSTGARVSEALALTPASFIHDGYDLQVVLSILKRRGRPKKTAVIRSPKRYIPIWDPVLQSRIREYLFARRLNQTDRLFPICRQTVNRHIKRLVEEGGGAPFRISSHTLRHSFAIHLILHGRPLKYVSQLLGHRSIESTEIYTKVLTNDGAHFMEGVEFH